MPAPRASTASAEPLEPRTLLSGWAGTMFACEPVGLMTEVLVGVKPSAPAATGRRKGAPGSAHSTPARGRTAPRQMFIRIAGKVFGDADGDGRRDRGEGPLSGVVVYFDSVNGPSEPPPLR